MANLSAAREDQRKDDELVAFPVKTGVTIYKGALVGVDSTGYAKPAATTDKRILGVAYETVAAGAAASGTYNVRVTRKGSYQFNASGLAITNVGDKVYVTDDNTVQTSSTSTIQVGVITEFISATSVRVAITPNV